MFYEIVKITNDMFMTKFLPIKLSELIGFFFFFFRKHPPPKQKNYTKMCGKRRRKVISVSFQGRRPDYTH